MSHRKQKMFSPRVLEKLREEFEKYNPHQMQLEYGSNKEKCTLGQRQDNINSHCISR